MIKGLLWQAAAPTNKNMGDDKMLSIQESLAEAVTSSFVISEGGSVFEELLHDFIGERVHLAATNCAECGEQQKAVSAAFKALANSLTGEMRSQLFNLDSEYTAHSVLTEKAAYLQGIRDALDMMGENTIIWELLRRKVAGEVLR